uniref:Kinesin motor domain-containing protein n=1 Tax=Oryza punctata TaxID=4537 RepID=A0A0E0KJ24_ORYPU
MPSDCGDDDHGGSSAPAGFELQEDPSFWKDNNVQVVIRVRPLSNGEISVQGQKRCVRQDSCQSITWTGHPESRFKFDLVADEHVTQENLFKVAGVPMVDNCMAGYNSCMFAYGQIREDAKKGVHVENLTEHEVSNAREAMQQLVEGAANRKVAATNMNRASSRSHSVFTCLIESKWESQGINHHRFSRLNLVDLAGSERQKSSGAEGERLKEATNINKSLSTLGLVITNLIAVSNKKSHHVPYRDSKLTFLLQDSLGGNSKTTIIANISPSSCCAAETLSTLKFAQRAKYIRNNAIINEDASGDVLSMRLQIQHLKKEVSRLQGLVNSDKAECTSSNGFICESPSTLKWNQGQGSFSPLMFDKRAMQRKDYDAALVAAFRREQETEAKLKAMIAAKLVAEQLATQRAEEVRSFKMRLRFREDRIKRLEQVTSGKLSAEAHLLQEKEDLVKEVDALRGLLDRNPEVTRFAMENLQLKEDIRRLQTFVDEGEREMMHEQIIVLQDKLLEALDWKLMHEKDPINKDLSFLGEPAADEEMEFLRLQAIQNEREIESLRKNLSFCLESKEKLERRVDELTLELEAVKKYHEESEAVELQVQTEGDLHDLPDAQTELKTLVDAIATASQREAEAHETAIGLAKENEELRTRLTVLIEDNKRLVELYEHAIANVEVNQDWGHPAIPQIEGVNEQQSSHPSYGGGAANGVLPDDKPESATFLPADNSSSEVSDSKIMDRQCNHKENFSRTELTDLQLQLDEMHEENDKLMGLYEKAMQERDEFKRKFFEGSNSVTTVDTQYEDVEMRDATDDEDLEVKHVHDSAISTFKEILRLVRIKLENVQDKLVITQDAVQYFKLLEMASTKAEELSASIQLHCLELKHAQEDMNALKSELSQSEESKETLEGRYFLPVASCWNLDLKTKALVGSKFDVSLELLNQKKEQLSHLQTLKKEFSIASTKAHESETVLRSKIDGLKVKLRSFEAQRKEAERVLFAIDNIDTSTPTLSKPVNFGKASELLRSEEERTKLLSELKKSREQLIMVQKEIKSMNRHDDIDCKIASLESEVENCCLTLLEADIEKFVHDNTLTEIWKEGQKDMDCLLVDYQECVFKVNLKEEEIMACEESLQHQTRSLDDMNSKLNQAMCDLGELLRDRTPCNLDASMLHVSDKVKGDLDAMALHVAEAMQLLLVHDENHEPAQLEPAFFH